MKTAKKFLKAKGLKDTLYNVNYNPNQNRGLPQKEWIKGGLSALLDEYADAKVKNFSSNLPVSGLLPSDEEANNMVNDFIEKWAEMNPALDKNFYWSGVNDGVYMLLNKLRGNNR